MNPDTRNSPLLIGAAAVDITPAKDRHLSGDGRGQHRPAQEVLDPLYATAMIFESGGRRACVIVVDLTIVAEVCTSPLRQQIAAELETQPEAVMICATQTHSAPSLGDFMLDPDFALEDTPNIQYLRGSEKAYLDFVMPRIIAATRQARQQMRAARMAHGRGLVGDYAFNRRGILRNGGIVMPKPFGGQRQPLGPLNLSHLEGPMDPEVGVIAFQSSGELTGLMLHHTCHPVINFGKPERFLSVSADWCGAWANQMRQRVGGPCVPMVLNGCCGNINPWHPFDANFNPDEHRMGAALADMTEQVMAGMTWTDGAIVDFASRRVALPYREVPAERAAEVERILSKNPQPPYLENGRGVDPVWFRAASTRSVELARKRSPTFDYEVQVIRIGDTAIVGLPGEPFVEGQLALKQNSPAALLQVAHMSSHYIGYLPTRDAAMRDGHESNADVTYWAKLAPGSLESVVACARDMVQGLFAP